MKIAIELAVEGMKHLTTSRKRERERERKREIKAKDSNRVDTWHFRAAPLIFSSFIFPSSSSSVPQWFIPNDGCVIHTSRKKNRASVPGESLPRIRRQESASRILKDGRRHLIRCSDLNFPPSSSINLHMAIQLFFKISVWMFPSPPSDTLRYSAPLLRRLLAASSVWWDEFMCLATDTTFQFRPQQSNQRLATRLQWPVASHFPRSASIHISVGLSTTTTATATATTKHNASPHRPLSPDLSF